MEKREIHGEEAPAPAPAPAAMQQLNDHEDGPHQAAAAAAGEGGGGGGLRGALQQLIELGDDRRLQAASFFLVWGCCMLIHATILNPATNPEHKFVGFVVLITGAWLALLTLAGGAGAGRAAARVERFLRGLFF